jgi:hypothetical protein
MSTSTEHDRIRIKLSLSVCEKVLDDFTNLLFLEVK